MLKRVFNRIYGLARPISLKRTLVVVLILCTLLPLILIGAISYYSLHQLQWDRISNGIRQNLGAVRTGLENTLNNLDYASKQLAYNGRVGDKVVSYLETGDVTARYEYGKEISDYITLISFTNPDIGIMFYYFPDADEPLFPNYQVREGFRPSALPVFVQTKGVTYYGPHTTAYRQSENTVFAISRKLDIYQKDCYIYIELNFSLFEKLLSASQYGVEASHILLDGDGKIVYSGEDVKDVFPVGGILPPAEAGERYDEAKGYYLFREASAQGWQIAAAIDKRAYDRVVYDWLRRFFLLAAIALAVSLLLALAVWEIVYRPLNYLNREMGKVSQSNFHSEIRLTKVHEFNDLLSHFQHMKRTIAGLFQEIEQKEKLKRRVEVEKLLYQINPHFLYNTLNTVQWFARMNGQDKIDRFVALLTSVLQYNLGREGGIVRIGQELEALGNYVELQRMRLDNQLDVKITADERTLDASIPRFLLQPLVENAIYHGLKDENGEIRVDVRCEGEDILITVKDNGEGMDSAEIQRMLEGSADRKIGMGIGLSYVRRMIGVHYGERAQLTVESAAGQGATFTLRIPNSGGGLDAK